MHKDVYAVDLFCGIGGLSYGMKQAGISVVAGIDNDPSCRFAFEKNLGSSFICTDVRSLEPDQINNMYPTSSYQVLIGCAPCQPFSTYTHKLDKNEDNRWQLLHELGRIIKGVTPDIIVMENVPRIVDFKHSPVFQVFTQLLNDLGYNVSHTIVFAPDYGIPQKRKRLVLLASKLGEIKLIPPTHSPDQYMTVREAIGGLERIESGQMSDSDHLHRAAKLSEKNLKRIKQSTPGGSWKRDWEHNLLLNCHKESQGKSYGSIYGRMKWDEPSPTMTTFCTGIGNGRFGHPEQDRAISLREAALLQSFPPSFKFFENVTEMKYTVIAKHIGNAVPPRLGEIIGQTIIRHIRKLENEQDYKK